MVLVILLLVCAFFNTIGTLAYVGLTKGKPSARVWALTFNTFMIVVICLAAVALLH